MNEVQQSLRILVVEDEYLLAEDLRMGLTEQNMVVVGPAGSVKDALALIAAETIDAAVLDISLNGENVIPVVEALSARSVLFVFATGYDAFDLPLAWRDVPRFEKPVDTAVLAKALRRSVVP